MNKNTLFSSRPAAPALLLATALVACGALLSPALAQAAETAAQPAAAKPVSKSAKPAAKKAADKTADKKAGKNATAASTTEIPEAVRQQMNELIEKAVQAISPVLQKGDEFLPYGVLQMKDSSLKLVEWKQPNPPAVPEVLRGIFITIVKEAAKNSDVVATAIVSPTSTMGTPVGGGSPMQVHGLRVEADHRDGSPVWAFMPYERTAEGIKFGTVLYQGSQNPVFAHGKAAAAAPVVSDAKSAASSASSAAVPAAASAPTAPAAPAAASAPTAPTAPTAPATPAKP